MKQTINFNDFVDAFRRSGREDHFSYEAKQIIFDWLEEYDRDNDTETELDVIGLVCEYIEMTPEEIIKDWSLDIELDGNESLAVQDFINDETMLLGVTPQGTIVFANY